MSKDKNKNMSITKQNTIICDECGLFCKPYDEYTNFGCSSEPLEPNHICRKCYPKVRQGWIKTFRDGGRNGDWQKSNAEIEAAKICKLKWVGSNGVGILGTNYFLENYRYYDEKLYDRMAKLPYFGWCMKCGAKRKGGYCSDKKCSESFKG
jgi:hypothetical protein